MQLEGQITLEDIENEIKAELNSPQQLDEGAEHAARKPYRITDFDSPRDKEMAVFTHAKKLSEYIFVITEKSPKKLRWSIISRLQNASVDVIENLYKANFSRDDEKRLQYQRNAMVSLRLLDFYTETARKKQAITIRQTAIIAKQLGETDKLLNGWIRSTKRK